MALLSDYTAGTISVAANGTTVTGVGTAFQTAQFQEGDWFIANGFVSVVASVVSNTELTLVPQWQGGALTASPYRLRYMSDGSRASAQARQLIDMLGGSGNLEAIAGLVSAPNTMPYFTGAGVANVTPLTPFARTILDDANAAAVRTTIGAGDVSGAASSIFGEIAAFSDATGKNLTPLRSGTAIPSNNYNLAVNSGFYVPPGSSAVNPPPSNAAFGGLIVSSRTSAVSTQFATDLSGNIYTRVTVNSGSTWTPYKTFYSGETILGTVSQVSGIPTGAIIEAGSNANGRYTKLADGTLICTKTININVAAASLFTDSTGELWSSVFSVVPSIVITPSTNYGNALASATVLNVATNSFTARAFNQINSANTAGVCTLNALAVGRWF